MKKMLDKRLKNESAEGAGKSNKSRSTVRDIFSNIYEEVKDTQEYIVKLNDAINLDASWDNSNNIKERHLASKIKKAFRNELIEDVIDEFFETTEAEGVSRAVNHVVKEVINRLKRIGIEDNIMHVINRELFEIAFTKVFHDLLGDIASILSEVIISREVYSKNKQFFEDYESIWEYNNKVENMRREILVTIQSSGPVLHRNLVTGEGTKLFHELCSKHENISLDAGAQRLNYVYMHTSDFEDDSVVKLISQEEPQSFELISGGQIIYTLTAETISNIKAMNAKIEKMKTISIK